MLNSTVAVVDDVDCMVAGWKNALWAIIFDFESFQCSLKLGVGDQFELETIAD